VQIMIKSQFKNSIAWQLYVMLVVACGIVLFDYLPEVKQKDDSTVCLQLYASKGDHLITFLQVRDEIGGSFDNVPVTLAPFFFKQLNINSADEDILMTVKGIGPKLSESIVRQRYLRGPFKSIDDLLNLKGVGPKRAEYFTKVFSFGELH